MNHEVLESSPRTPWRLTLVLLAGAASCNFGQVQEHPAALLLVEPNVGPDDVPFTEPPVWEAENGVLDKTLEVVLVTTKSGGEEAHYRLYKDADSDEPSVPGPTWKIRPGDRVRIKVVNQLPEKDSEDPLQMVGAHDVDINVPHGMNVTNLHTHGFWVSPAGNSDNVFVRIKPQKSFQYEYSIPESHVAGTFWYHPHKHGSVASQVANGMAGAIVMQGGIDELEGIAGRRERLMLLQQILPQKLAVKKAMARRYAEPPIAPEESKTTINGDFRPTLEMRPGQVERWRLIAANAHDSLSLRIRPQGTKEGIPIHPIAYDGIPAVGDLVETREVMLGPGNRVDILVKAPALSAGEDQAVYEIFKRWDRIRFDTVKEDEIIGYLIVRGEPDEQSLPREIPAEYAHPTIQEDELTGARHLLFSVIGQPAPQGPRFTINNKQFSPDRVDQLVSVGSVEEWTLFNDSEGPHPFHIHVNPFQVVGTSRDDEDSELGRYYTSLRNRWLDTILVPPPAEDGKPGSVTIRSRFELFVGRFVLHCHILEHEDQGMMQIVEITE